MSRRNGLVLFFLQGTLMSTGSGILRPLGWRDPVRLPRGRSDQVPVLRRIGTPRLVEADVQLQPFGRTDASILSSTVDS